MRRIEGYGLEADKGPRCQDHEAEHGISAVYAAEAEGCFRVPETGTFRFSSDCDRVWIDGQLLIDNGGAVKRSSHNDAELVLEAGAHNYKVLFIYNVIGGWISLRSRCDVLFRQPGSESWTSVAGDSARLID